MQIRNPGQLTAFTSVGEIDDANDKLVVWDNSQGVLKSVTFRALDEDAGVVNVTNYGATGDGVTDDTAAIQAAINACAGGYYTLYFPKGVYLYSQLTCTSPYGLQFVGEGMFSSELRKFSNGDDEIGIHVNAAGSIVQGFALIDIRLGSNEYTRPKTAVKLVDISECTIRNVYVSGFTGNEDIIAFHTQGRQNLWMDNVYISATIGLYVGKNPNTSSGWLSADGFHLKNVSFINDAGVPATLPHAVIIVESGAHVSNFNWYGGGIVTKRHGFYWVSDGTEYASSTNLHIRGIRTEGTSDANTYYSFYIDIDTGDASPDNVLYGLSIADSELNANCKALYTRNVYFVSLKDSMCHQASIAGTIDIGGCRSFKTSNVSWLSTASASSISVDSNMYMVYAEPTPSNHPVPFTAKWIRRNIAANYDERPVRDVNNMSRWSWAGTVASNGTVLLPCSNTSGYDWQVATINVIAKTSTACEYGEWRMAPLAGFGSNGCVKESGSTNTSNTDSGSNLAVYCDGGYGAMISPVVKNRLGADAYFSIVVTGYRTSTT